MNKRVLLVLLALALMPLTVFGFSLDEPENMNEQTGYYYQGKKNTKTASASLKIA